MAGLRGWWRRLRDDEAGAVAVYVAVSAPMLIGLAVSSIDVGLVTLMEHRLQITADAAALAAADLLPDENAALAGAQAIARANIPDADGTTVLAANDIEMGRFDAEDGTFTVGAADADAVRVTTRRAAANRNAFALLTGRMLTIGPLDLEAIAIAERRRDPCITDGFVAHGRIVMNSNNHFSGVCLHGRAGAALNSNNTFSAGSGLSMPDLSDLDVKNNKNNPGLDEAKHEKVLTPVDARSIDDIIADFEAGRGPWPDYLDGRLVSVSSLPAAPTAGTLYVVDDGVSLKGDYSGFGILTKGSLTIRSNSTVENMLLVAEGGFTSNSNVDIGGADYCGDGGGAVFIAARNDIDIAANTGFRGTQIIAGGDLTMGANQDDIAALAVQAGGDITLASNARSDCNNKAHVLFDGGEDAIRLRLVR